MHDRFLDQNDWLAFTITAFLSLSVYWFTLSPSIEPGKSGIFATGAMYPGVPQVPGYPLWTMYAWLFSVLLPVSEIAWRTNVASATAAALACGVTALLASRYARELLRDPSNAWGNQNEAKALRLVCAVVAGLALAFDRAFWSQAVITDPWTLSVLFFALTLALFLRWQHAPGQTRWFHAAVFMFGLTLTNSQALAPAALGFELFILFIDLNLARDVFAATTILLATVLLDDHFEYLPWPLTDLQRSATLNGVYETIGIFTFSTTVVLAWFTRCLFTRWRTVLAGAACLGLGLSPYLLLPVFSMTDPPMNWGYPRTVEGFVHVLTRGQYEHVVPAENLARYWTGVEGYLKVSFEKFGSCYLLASLIPFVMISRLEKHQRKFLLGLLFVFLSLSLFMVYLLNPPADRASQDMHELFYSPSHLVLALLAGCGLAMAGRRIAGPRKKAVQAKDMV